MVYSAKKWAADCRKYNYIKDADGSVVRVKKKDCTDIQKFHDIRAAERRYALKTQQEYSNMVAEFIAAGKMKVTPNGKTGNPKAACQKQKIQKTR